MQLSFYRKNLISIPLLLGAVLCMALGTAVQVGNLWFYLLNCAGAACMTLSMHLLTGCRNALSVYAVCVSLMAVLEGPGIISASEDVISEYASSDIGKMMPIAAVILAFLFFSMLFFMFMENLSKHGEKYKKISLFLNMAVAVSGSIALLLFACADMVYVSSGIVLSVCLCMLCKHAGKIHNVE